MNWYHYSISLSLSDLFYLFYNALQVHSCCCRWQNFILFYGWVVFHYIYYIYNMYYMTSLVAQMVKRLSTMWETWVRSLDWEDPLEKAVAPHSSTIAWKIPWTEEPGRLQSMESLRVGHDWATSLSLDILATVNNAVMNIGVHLSFWINIFVFLIYIQEWNC